MRFFACHKSDLYFSLLSDEWSFSCITDCIRMNEAEESLSV